MGFDAHTIKYLLAAQKSGVSFESVLTIGRQTLFTNAREFHSLLRDFGLDVSRDDVDKLLTENKGYAERFLARIGAGKIDSLDASEYEKATIIHDLNQPIPDELKNRFSLVIDGGSLEHVFDVPTALKSLMEMVAVGGHFIAINPANNFFGHGFYQFSPDIFFRCLSAENGFEIDRVIAFELRNGAPWYSVVDPQEANRRVKLTNRRPVHLIVQAKKTAEAEIFAETPQQFKYSDLWDQDERRRGGDSSSLLGRVYQVWRRESNRLIRATVKPKFNPTVFRKIRAEGLTEGQFET